MLQIVTIGFDPSSNPVPNHHGAMNKYVTSPETIPANSHLDLSHLLKNGGKPCANGKRSH
jgi:hypothetical protein